MKSVIICGFFDEFENGLIQVLGIISRAPVLDISVMVHEIAVADPSGQTAPGTRTLRRSDQRRLPGSAFGGGVLQIEIGRERPLPNDMKHTLPLHRVDQSRFRLRVCKC